MWGGSELFGIRARVAVSFLLDRSDGRGHYFFSEPSPNRASRWAPYLRLHLPGSHSLLYPDDSLRPCPTQLSDPPKLFPVAFLYKWLVLTPASDFSKFSQTSSIWLLQAPYFLLTCLRPSTSSTWPWFTGWSGLGTSNPSTSSGHLHTTL